MRRGRCPPLYSSVGFNPLCLVAFPRVIHHLQLRRLPPAGFNSAVARFTVLGNLPGPGITSGHLRGTRVICVRLSERDYRQIRKMKH